MDNAASLRKELANVFDDLRNGKVEPKVAAELANIAGKMIGSAKAQIEYGELTKRPQTIAFLEERPSETPA